MHSSDGRTTFGPECAAWLAKLADHLAASPSIGEGFNMGTWWSQDTRSCETAGCALGWGIRDHVTPPGLELRQMRSADADCDCQACVTSVSWVPVFEDGGVLSSNFTAIAEAFQMPDWCSGYLFDPDEYVEDFDDRSQIAIEDVVERLRLLANMLDASAELDPETQAGTVHLSLLVPVPA